MTDLCTATDPISQLYCGRADGHMGNHRTFHEDGTESEWLNTTVVTEPDGPTREQVEAAAASFIGSLGDERHAVDGDGWVTVELAGKLSENPWREWYGDAVRSKGYSWSYDYDHPTKARVRPDIAKLLANVEVRGVIPPGDLSNAFRELMELPDPSEALKATVGDYELGADKTEPEPGTAPTAGQLWWRLLSRPDQRLMMLEGIMTQANLGQTCYEQNHEQQLTASAGLHDRLARQLEQAHDERRAALDTLMELRRSSARSPLARVKDIIRQWVND